MGADATRAEKTGPLAGMKVIEMAGLGPVPLAALMLAEMGAEVLRIERTGETRPFLDLPDECDLARHGRSILELDLKTADGRGLFRKLAEKTDVLLEGFRPGVMERLGLGPDAMHAFNPALVYGRMTGFGQDGPLANHAGHDITYLALSGVLSAIGRKGEKPVPPLNLIGDYGGGTMMLLTGVLAALLSRARTGKGQVIDASMVEGAAMLSAPLHAYMAAGLWHDARGENLLDGGAPFYDTYETSDGGYVAVGCLEPRFFAEFARLLPLDQRFVAAQYDRAQWEDMRTAITDRMRQRTRAEWSAHFAGSDACVTPVLSLGEAADHPHNRARRTFIEVGALRRPAPAPRFSATPSVTAEAPHGGDRERNRMLARFGLSDEEIDALVKAEAMRQ